LWGNNIASTASLAQPVSNQWAYLSTTASQEGAEQTMLAASDPAISYMPLNHLVTPFNALLPHLAAIAAAAAQCALPATM
jgi:hypothetical protein